MAKITVSTCDGKHEITPMCLYREGMVTQPIEDPTIVESDISEENQ